MTVVTFPPASDDLPWTGERFLVGRTGQIEFEHYHRYLFAMQVCRDRDVLDIASGEGYGSFLLSQVAKAVTGVDIDTESILHANKAYGSGNRTFIEGSCTKIPLANALFDVVVSFETIEHIRDQDEFLMEVRRVLRPGGLLVVSTPDRGIYGNPAEPNPFHQLELSKSEFLQLLSRHFHNVDIGLQKAMCGSAILPSNSIPAGIEVFFRTGVSTFESHATLERAPFLIALASDTAIPSIQWGMLDDAQYLQRLSNQCLAEQRGRQDVEQRLAECRHEVEVRDAQLAAAATEQQRLVTEQQRLVTEQQRLVTEQQRLVAERQRLTGDFEALEHRLNAIENSTSWRIAKYAQAIIRKLGLARD